MQNVWQVLQPIRKAFRRRLRKSPSLVRPMCSISDLGKHYFDRERSEAEIEMDLLYPPAPGSPRWREWHGES